MDADGRNVVSLTDNASSDADPAWSPDGQRIAFTSNRFGNGDVFVMNLDGSGVRRLTTFGNNPLGNRALQPAWSPDGSMIAYTVRPCYAVDRCSFEIRVMNSDGSGDRSLVTDGQQPAWSSSGLRIVYTSMYCYFYYVTDPCYGAGLRIINPNGTSHLTVTRTYTDHSPAWR
jgi:TolB protein